MKVQNSQVNYIFQQKSKFYSCVSSDIISYRVVCLSNLNKHLNHLIQFAEKIAFFNCFDCQINLKSKGGQKVRSLEKFWYLKSKNKYVTPTSITHLIFFHLIFSPFPIPNKPYSRYNQHTYGCSQSYIYYDIIVWTQ